jgi:hypothetical protein
MTASGVISREAAKKTLLGGDDPGVGESGTSHVPSGNDRRLETDDKTAADDLVRLVLALVDTVRQLMERQAIRRVENGSLSDDEIERLGLTLMRLEERMAELKEHFGMTGEDLALRLGTVQDLMDVLEGDEASGKTEG